MEDQKFHISALEVLCAVHVSGNCVGKRLICILLVHFTMFKMYRAITERIAFYFSLLATDKYVIKKLRNI